MNGTVYVLIFDDSIDKIRQAKMLVYSAIRRINDSSGNGTSLEHSIDIATDPHGALNLLKEKQYTIMFMGYVPSKSGIGAYEVGQIINGTYQRPRPSRIDESNKGLYAVGFSTIWCGGIDSSEMHPLFRGVIDDAINPEIKDDLETRFEQSIRRAITPK